MDRTKRYKEQTQIIAKCWEDNAFKERFKKNPRAAAQELGIQIPQQGTLHIYEETSSDHYFVIPAKPDGNFKETELKNIAAGMSGNGTGFSG